MNKLNIDNHFEIVSPGFNRLTCNNNLKQMHRSSRKQIRTNGNTFGIHPLLFELYNTYPWLITWHKRRGWGAGGGSPPVFEKLCQSGKFSNIIWKYSGKNQPKQYRIKRLHTKRAMPNQKEIVFVNISMSKVSITSKLINICMSLYSGKYPTPPPPDTFPRPLLLPGPP